MSESEVKKERPVDRNLRGNAGQERPDPLENELLNIPSTERSGKRSNQEVTGQDGETAIPAGVEPTAQLFDDLRHGFDAAMNECPDSVHEYFLAVAGSPSRLRVVGHDLADHLLKPWGHLIIPRPAATVRVLSIDVWDENATQIRCQVPDATFSRPKMASSPDGRFRGQQSPHTLSCLDQQEGRLIASAVWDDRVSTYEWSRPLIVPLIYWSELQGVSIVHAGLVSLSGDGVLLPGRSGAGKSTGALSCVIGGHAFLGDDLVGVQCLASGEYLGHSLHASVSIDAKQLERFPEAARHAASLSSSNTGKLLVSMWDVYPHSLRRSVPIRAVAIPRVSGRQGSRLQPAAKRDALIAMGVNSLFLIPRSDGGLLDRLSDLIERLPCYWLELGSDVESIARCAEEIFTGRTG